MGRGDGAQMIACRALSSPGGGRSRGKIRVRRRRLLAAMLECNDKLGVRRWLVSVAPSGRHRDAQRGRSATLSRWMWG